MDNTLLLLTITKGGIASMEFTRATNTGRIVTAFKTATPTLTNAFTGLNTGLLLLLCHGETRQDDQHQYWQL